MTSDKTKQELIDRFWSEYGAYAVQDFKKNGYYYDKKPLESAVIRIAVDEVDKAKKECIPLIKEFRGTAKLIKNCLEAGNLKLLVENIEYQLQKVREFEKQLSG